MQPRPRRGGGGGGGIGRAGAGRGLTAGPCSGGGSEGRRTLSEATAPGALVLEPAHAWARRAGARGARDLRGPGLGKVPRRRGGEAGPGVPRSRQLSSAESRATECREEGKALTCKQGLPSGGARSERAPDTLTCTPTLPRRGHLPTPGPTRQGPEVGAAAAPAPAPAVFGLCGEEAQCPALGPGSSGCRWEWWTPRSPALDSGLHPGSPGFPPPPPAARRAARWEGAGLHFGAGI